MGLAIFQEEWDEYSSKCELRWQVVIQATGLTYCVLLYPINQAIRVKTAIFKLCEQKGVDWLMLNYAYAHVQAHVL